MANFYVSKSGLTGWRVIQRTWEGDKYKHSKVERLAYPLLGLNEEWTIDQAKERVKQLNSSNSERRKENHSAARSAHHANSLSKLASLYAPVELSMRFIEWLKADSFGGARHKKRLVYHFNYIRKMVRDLKLDANEFYEKRNLIYRYFMDDTVSPDSVATILRVMNKWADFVCRERKQYYREIEAPKGQVRAMINDAYADSADFRGGSDPLTPDMYDTIDFRQDHANWLYLTIWLGVRPQEATGFHNPKNWKVTTKNNITVLHVYMPKLTALPRDQRWKLIPLIQPEQLKCIEIITSGVFKAPLLKTLRAKFPTKRVTLYGGRKGFTSLMLDRKQNLEDISMWMGHQNIERTWSEYRDKTRVSWTG